MKKNKTRVFNLCTLLALLICLQSCNVTKYLVEDESLYTGAEVVVKTDSLKNVNGKQLKQNLQTRVTPKPNTKFLGLYIPLWFYLSNKEPKKEKGFRYWKKYQLGEPPVLEQDVDFEFNETLLKNYAQNRGYFDAEVEYDTIKQHKKTSVQYIVQPDQQYLLDTVKFEVDAESVLGNEISQLRQTSLLKKGKPFDLAIIQAERQRIDDSLKNKGFYYFSPDHLIVQADTTNTTHRADLYLQVKDETPQKAREQYKIDKVIVYPNYSFSGLENQRNPVPTKTDSIEIFNDIYLVDEDDAFREVVFDRALQFRSGDLYNRKDHNLTLNRLISLGVFKFVKNQFYPSDSLENTFDAYYLLTPKEFQSLQLEVLGNTNSADFVGSEVNVNWLHRNFFKGAELFQLKALTGFNLQVGGNEEAESNIGNLLRYGAEAKLSIPRIVAPFKLGTAKEYVPRTNFALGYEFQQRTTLYTLQNLNASAGYLWKENESQEHQLKLMDITYVQPQKITDRFLEESANNPSLQRIVDKQLIFGPSYQYTYTNTFIPKKNTFFFQGKADFSGNITGLLMGANVAEDNQQELFGVAFSQYAKGETDFRYYLKTSERSTLATRFIGGVAYPYGNSEEIPFSKQFFSGGTNSVRGFRARTIGPGSFDPRSNNNSVLFDQSGDVKLETSVEYRPHIYNFLEGALFVDAGNVWLVNENEQFPGGELNSDFLNELAVSGGVGMRMDFQILLLRLDLAMKLRKPYLEDPWIFNDFDIGDADWRQENLVLNIAIGYPF